MATPHVAGGILGPHPGIKPMPLALALGVLTTGPSGKFQIVTVSKLEGKTQERERLRIQEQRERRRGTLCQSMSTLVELGRKEGRKREV